MKNNILPKLITALTFIVTIIALNHWYQAQAASVTLYPTNDTYVSKETPGAIGGTGLLLMNSFEALKTTRVLIKFDLSQIPSNATIDNAKLRLYKESLTGISSIGVKISLCNADWLEGAVTWNSKPSDTPVSNASATVSTSVTWMAWDVTSDVKAWVSRSRSNYGFMLIPGTAGSTYRLIFKDRHSSYKPELLVGYTVPQIPIEEDEEDEEDDAVEFSEIKVTNITPTTATITWKTDVDSTSGVSYTKDMESVDTEENSRLTKNHTINLTGLTPNTAYFYAVASAREDGSEKSSGLLQFVTDREIEESDVPVSQSQPVPTPTPVPAAVPTASQLLGGIQPDTNLGDYEGEGGVDESAGLVAQPLTGEEAPVNSTPVTITDAGMPSVASVALKAISVIGVAILIIVLIGIGVFIGNRKSGGKKVVVAHKAVNNTKSADPQSDEEPLTNQ